MRTHLPRARSAILFQKNVAFGLFWNYNDTDFDGTAADSTFWMIGPQATVNFSIDPKLSFFVNGGVGYSNYDLANNDADGFGLKVGGGVKYFFARNVGIVGQLKYTRCGSPRPRAADWEYACSPSGSASRSF
jgi:opacity protein-like surface antigen